MTEVTYYFNDYDTEEMWASSAWLMIDGQLDTYSSTTLDGDTELCTENSYPGGQSETINKVEIRAHGFGDGDDRIDLIPVFGGTTSGNEYQCVMPSSSGWGAYQDITNDPNAPSWNWTEIQNLDCRVEFDKVGKGGTMRCHKIEIRVTHGLAVGHPTMKRWHGIPGMNFTGRKGGW